MPTVALLSWIVIAPLLAARLTPSQIVIWLTLVPYLFLPEAFAINLPGLPDIDKTAAISIGLVLSYALHRGKFDDVKLPEARARLLKILIAGCFGLMVVGALLTLVTNREPVIYGPLVLSGLRLWDAVSVLSSIVFVSLPFFFAARYLAAPGAHRELLFAFVATGLFYSLLMLVEIRLSPQLHTWVYGFFQHSFFQHIRDGFRPIVFLEHGIWVGFFVFMTMIAALGLWKISKEPKWLFAALWLTIVLVISRNLGATVIGLLCAGIFLFSERRVQTVFAASIAVIVLFYPAIRKAQMLPLDQIHVLASSISADRAQSLLYRLENEDQLLARASLKPLAGWGGYNRERIYDEWGKLISIPDGLWILVISTRGWIGYLALFGIFTAPIIFLWLSGRQAPPPPETMTLVMIITGNLIYMIPNATLTAICWLVFGALTGFLLGSHQENAEATHEPTSTPEQKGKLAYTRFANSSGLKERKRSSLS